MQDQNTVCTRLPAFLHVILWLCVFVCLSVTPPYPLFHGWAAPSAPGDPQTDTVGCAALWLTLFVCVCVHGCVYACVGTLREFIPPANFTQSLMLTLMPTIWVVTKIITGLFTAAARLRDVTGCNLNLVRANWITGWSVHISLTMWQWSYLQQGW